MTIGLAMTMVDKPTINGLYSWFIKLVMVHININGLYSLLNFTMLQFHLLTTIVHWPFTKFFSSGGTQHGPPMSHRSELPGPGGACAHWLLLSHAWFT